MDPMIGLEETCLPSPIHHFRRASIYFLWLIISFPTMESPTFCDLRESIVSNIFISHGSSPDAIIISKDSPT